MKHSSPNKDPIEQALICGKIEEAFSLALSMAKQQNRDISYLKLLALLTVYHLLAEEYLMGLISPETYYNQMAVWVEKLLLTIKYA